MSDAILLRDVTKTFGTHPAVDSLSLVVPRGSVFGFIGPNGSGKTTTIRMVLNIILPDAGVISVLGRSDSRTARDDIGYLPEERGLYRKMKVGRLLSYYAALKGLDRRSAKIAAARWLERLGIGAWRDRRVEALSKGMAQKVQFIAAAISDPAILILDEPFSGLDPVNVDLLEEAILELRRRGTTIVFSTHDMATAERLCDRICMIFRGRKVLDGTLDEIQAAYGHDTVRVRTGGGAAVLEGLPGIEAVTDRGNLQEVRLAQGADAQELLRQLAARTAIQRFEVARPSLHDIFVRIAGPEAAVAAAGGAVEAPHA